MEEELAERFELMQERIAEIAQHAEFPAPFGFYFENVARHISQSHQLYALVNSGQIQNLKELELRTLQEQFFLDLMNEHYEESFLNPAYACKELGNECGAILSAIYADFLSCYTAAYEQDVTWLCIFGELFLQCYGCFVEELQESGFGRFSEESLRYIEGNLKDAIYWFYHDYCEFFAPDPIVRMMDSSYDFFYRLIMESDLSDLSYLYQFGFYVGDNERKVAQFLLTLSDEEITSMARTYTSGYEKGFVNTGRDLSRKKYVRVEAPLGFERLTREAIRQFEAMGLSVTINRESILSFYGRGNGKRGYYATSINRQFDYDHKDDRAIYFDKSFVERRLEVIRETYEKHKDAARLFAGPAVVEVFGERVFNPINKPERLSYTAKQEELNVYQATENGKITNAYIPGEEYSFTIISYPIPEIGDDFEAIFAKTVEVNTLDYEVYKDVQQRIIDVLDQGVAVHVTGRGENHTDIIVSLHPLADPEKETIFENCVADVNIPVGEVFTSPVLAGTNGLLHVTGVYLGEFFFKDLNLTFRDGMITEYSCGNFPTPEENATYIRDNILHHHPTLPMGEFAIGTNTVAYRMARDFGIADRLPILIAEKTGPHFAVGDTCYSHAEDVPMYNFNGKEVVARENACSLLRKEGRENEAYFNCHTDITIPYDELGDITVLCKDGRELPIIIQGRFVVPGTEILNEALD